MEIRQDDRHGHALHKGRARHGEICEPGSGRPHPLLARRIGALRLLKRCVRGSEEIKVPAAIDDLGIEPGEFERFHAVHAEPEALDAHGAGTAPFPVPVFAERRLQRHPVGGEPERPLARSPCPEDQVREDAVGVGP